MDCPPLLVLAGINKTISTPVLIDSGCLSYGIISSRLVQRHHLQRIQVVPRKVESYNGSQEDEISEVAAVRLRVGGRTRRAFLYIVPRLMTGIDIMLGLPWLRQNRVVLDAEGLCLRFSDSQEVVRASEWIQIQDSH